MGDSMKFNPKQKIYLICNTGALGDTVSTFPILKILTERGHIEKMFVDNRYIALYSLFFDKKLIVNLKDAMTIIPKDKITPDIPQSVINPHTGEASFLSYPLIPNIPVVYSLNPRPSSIHMHLVDCFSSSICDAILKDTEKNYPLVNIKKLPKNPIKAKNYVVITYGATSEVKKMLPEVFNGLKNYFNEKGFKVVVIGKRDFKLRCGDKLVDPNFEGVDLNNCIDMIDKTNFPQALRIIYDAKMIIGLDNGLLHLAGLTNTPIVVAYTYADPYYLLPFRNGIKGENCKVVEPDEACRYCRTSTFCTYGIQFYDCVLGTQECTKSLTLEKYIEAIESFK
jgi:hypothetical protein